MDPHSSAVFEAGGTHTLAWDHWHARGPERLVALDRVIFGRFLVNGGAAYAADPRLTISSDFTGPRDTMSFREYGFVGSTTGWQPPVPYAPNIGSTIGHTLVGGAQDGSKSLDCTFADALGGTVAWTEKLFLDTTSPTVSALRSPTHPDEATWYAGSDPSFTWTGSDPRQNGNYAECASGVAGYSYVLDGSPATDPDTSVDGTGPAAAFSGLADGVWYFHVRAVDKVGNLSATSHWAVRDRTPSIGPLPMLVSGPPPV